MCKRTWWSLFMLVFGFWYFLYGADYIAYNYFHKVSYPALVETYAKQNDLPPELVAAVIFTESRFQEKAVSPRGAIGLMQLMPVTAHWIAEQRDTKVRSLADPEENIANGTWYLRYLYDHFHSPVLALAAYNAGRGHVEEWMDTYGWHDRAPAVEEIPFPETREFVASVLHYQAVYAEYFHPHEDEQHG